MKNKIFHYRFLNFSIAIFLIVVSISFGQSEDHKWQINVSVATMKPFFENDQWFVTSEGYHIHPRTEDYTPGFSLGIERAVTNKISLEFNILYGMPPATLGVIDQYSPTGREFLDTKRFHFLTVLVSPKLYIFNGKKNNVYFSPTVGYGILSEKTIDPTFGPSVTWVKNEELIYGGRIGNYMQLKGNNLFFLTEVQLLSMTVKVEESTSGHILSKTFGPLGILLGFSYSFN